MRLRTMLEKLEEENRKLRLAVAEARLEDWRIVAKDAKERVLNAKVQYEIAQGNLDSANTQVKNHTYLLEKEKA